MNKKLLIPAWLLGAAIFAQVLMVALNVQLIWTRAHPARNWSLDSVTYYRTLDGQGNLNLRLYEQIQQHNERLRALDEKRKTRHKHIDSLSGDALQREIDRQYNNGRQSYPTRLKTDTSDGSGRTSSTQRPRRPGHFSGYRSVPGYAFSPAEPGHCCPEPDDYAVEQTPAGKRQHRENGSGAGRPLPEETARSQVGELAGTGSRRNSIGRQAQTNLSYWQLILTHQFTYPDVAFAISAVETGYWHTQPGNNLFGMKKNQRGFYSSVSASGYCRYPTQQASLADYHAYEIQVIERYRLRSRRAYLAHICKRFCPNPAYGGKLDLAFQKLASIRTLT